MQAHRLRVALMALGVALGVSMLGGSLMYVESARTAFFEDLARAAIGVDLVAEPTGHTDPQSLINSPVVAAVSQLPGVAHADGRVIARLGLLNRRGRVIANGQDIGLAVSVSSWPGFSTYRVVAGQVPTAPGEAGLDRPTAEREKVGIGDNVTVLDQAGRQHQLRVVALLDFGAAKMFADASVLALTTPDLDALAGDPVDGDYAQIVVSAAPGTDLLALRQRLAATLGPSYTVATGEDLRQRLSTEAAKYTDSFRTTLLVTAMVSLAVAGLVVHNTFQIVIAHRRRESALLRCLGARRGQIVTLVLYEAAGIGLVASVVSVGLSVLAAKTLLVAQEVFGGGLPDYRLIITARSVLVPIGLGVAVSVISALLPALAGGRASPLDALRASSDSGAPARRGAVRHVLTTLIAVTLAAAGLGLLGSARGDGFDGLPAMASAAILIFASVVLMLPLVLTMLLGPLRFAIGKAFGATGRLAMDNTRRHPVRFAATTTAFIIGIAPLTMFALLLDTAKVQGVRELAENFPVDFVVSHPSGAQDWSSFDPALIEKIRAAPEFGVVALSRVGHTVADDRYAWVGTVEPGVLGDRLALEVRDGELGGLPVGTAAVTVSFATNHHLSIGDVISLGRTGHTWAVTVVATFDGSPVPAEVLVNWTDFTGRLAGGDDYLLIRRADGVSAAGAADSIDAALVSDPSAILTSTGQRRESLVDSLDRRQNQVNVLMAVSVVIAVLGIATALSLSILERGHESAVLRAMGLARRQLFGMLLLESALTAFVGAVIGVVFGIAFGWIIAGELIRDYGHGVPTIPVLMISLYLIIAALAATVASVLPARRAARASAVAAMTNVT